MIIDELQIIQYRNEQEQGSKKEEGENRGDIYDHDECARMLRRNMRMGLIEKAVKGRSSEQQWEGEMMHL